MSAFLLPDFSSLAPESPSFRTHTETLTLLEEVCRCHPDLATLESIGTSEEGRPLVGIVLGDGPSTVSLMAGNHADEPVGPETLRYLVVNLLRRRDLFEALLRRVRFVIVPHTNPDGETRNRRWIEQWPDAGDYLLHAIREPPGRDLEFGFPDSRAENRAVATFLERHAPFVLHASLHGMGFSEGAMLLIERQWAGRTGALRDRFRAFARDAGLPLHDHNREGEKGFFYIAPGFTTTPEGHAMRQHFEYLGDHEQASRFRLSSMEFVRTLGGDPLSVVTELPLFLLPKSTRSAYPEHYLSFRENLPALRARLRAAHARDNEMEALTPLTLGTAIGVHLKVIEAALGTVLRAR